MSESQRADWRDWLTDKGVDLRNELIVQTANAYLFMRATTLASLGFVVLGVDEIAAFVRLSVERGERVEADTRQMLTDYEERVKAQIEAAGSSRADLRKQVDVAIDEHVRIITYVLLPTRATNHSVSEVPPVAEPERAESEASDGDPPGSPAA